MNLSLFMNPVGTVHTSIPQFVRLEQTLAFYLRSEDDAKRLGAILCARISTEECMARQQLFSDLQQESSKAHFTEIYRCICDYQRSIERYEHFRKDFYAPLFYFEALSSYFMLVEQIAKTPAYLYMSPLMHGVIQVCSMQCQTHAYQQMKQSWEVLRNDANHRESITIDIKKRDRMFPASSVVPDKKMGSMLDDFADFLDIPQTVRPNITRLPGDVYQQLFVQPESYYGKIQAFYETYQQQDWLNLKVDPQSFRFFIDMDILFSRLREFGLPLCLPKMNGERDFQLEDLYDLSLCTQDVVLNSFEERNPYDVFIVSGANGGGKTCFLRAVCWCVFLAASGCYIPARSGVIPCDLELYAFVGVEESGNSGIYLQEKQFIEGILEKTTARTMLFLNEIMIGTGEMKACRELSGITERVIQQSAWLFCATHNYAYVDWAAHTYPAITMLQPVLCGNDHVRTFRVEKVTRENRSYSQDILQKYGLRKEDLEVDCL